MLSDLFERETRAWTGPDGLRAVKNDNSSRSHGEKDTIRD